MFGEHCIVKHAIGEENSVGVLSQLVQDSLRLWLRGLSDEQRLDLKSAADGFLDQPDPFNRAESVNGLALAESLAKLFDERVLSAGNGAQPG